MEENSPQGHVKPDSRPDSAMKLRVAALLAPVLLAGMAFLPQQQRPGPNYAGAESLRNRIDGLVVDAPEPANWINGQSLWYRKSARGGNSFVLVNATTLEKKPAFDHAAIAASLSQATGNRYTAVTLPFAAPTFSQDLSRFEFNLTADTARWSCTIADSRCARMSAGGGRGGRGGLAGGRIGGGLYGDPPPANPAPRASRDGKWEAMIRNYNVFVRALGTPGAQWQPLSSDGSEANAYAIQSLTWSPNSQKLAAYRVTPGYKREVHYVTSSPEDQIQPKHWSRLYNKPGDVLEQARPVIFDIATRRVVEPSNALFPNAYTVSAMQWRSDSRALTFEYNQRGHQAFRVLEVNPVSGAVRAIINEETPTFFEYSAKLYRFDIGDGAETLWMSERDGWNHLYLYNGVNGQVKNQVTKGDWLVRGVDRVDTLARQVYFRASGMYPGKNPYFIHQYRINLDGTGLVTYTEADANHVVRFSPDNQYYVDTYSRVDLPPVSELRRVSDQKLLLTLDKGDATALLATGWKPPESFVAKGRDGATDIYGVIIRPTNFDPRRKYSVIENIYAGPHDSFVPQVWGLQAAMRAQAELGFIVSQIDGMGTSNRSKKFHDVAWRNIGDAGFPDRILWHKAAAAKYPANYDANNVGIYGGSAGGQNSMGALLRHPDFYKAAVSYAGCHDNRMDKIWWNEQWMGWPLGAWYDSSSNVVNAAKLQGKLLLVVGELDTNVDPASTFQVANALIKASKTFDMLVIPGQDHNAGRGGETGPYGEKKQWDFFVHHLMGAEPPDRNAAMPVKP
jgi:dipeptidyl aminopeptidase/acylaminoacyl peptidase